MAGHYVGNSHLSDGWVKYTVAPAEKNKNCEVLPQMEGKKVEEGGNMFYLKCNDLD